MENDLRPKHPVTQRLLRNATEIRDLERFKDSIEVRQFLSLWLPRVARISASQTQGLLEGGCNEAFIPSLIRDALITDLKGIFHDHKEDTSLK